VLQYQNRLWLSQGCFSNGFVSWRCRMSGFVVQGPKSDYHDSSWLKNGLYPRHMQQPYQQTPVSAYEHCLLYYTVFFSFFFRMHFMKLLLVYFYEVKLTLRRHWTQFLSCLSFCPSNIAPVNIHICQPSTLFCT